MSPEGLVRTAGLEPALSERSRFSYHLGFRRRRLGVRGLDCPFAMAFPPKAPPIQSLHLPSQQGFGSGLAWGMNPLAFPDFERFYSVGFPTGTPIEVCCVYPFRHVRVVLVAPLLAQWRDRRLHLGFVPGSFLAPGLE